MPAAELPVAGCSQLYGTATNGGGRAGFQVCCMECYYSWLLGNAMVGWSNLLLGWGGGFVGKWLKGVAWWETVGSGYHLLTWCQQQGGVARSV